MIEKQKDGKSVSENAVIVSDVIRHIGIRNILKEMLKVSEILSASLEDDEMFDTLKVNLTRTLKEYEPRDTR